MDDLPADRQGEKGQALVEFALVVIPLLMLIFGGLALWWVLSDKTQLAFATNVACVWAAAHVGEEDQACAVVAMNTGSLADPAAVVCRAEWTDDSVHVEVAYPETLIPFFSTVVLHAEATVPR